ncbi:hypothetical protein AVEN_182693-1 [Araneus ventricosus]|uniref:Uncharacterized protein n=1 Tax=Araneus ventricosus TaxID=182803 RepID=A0A4Y2JTJ5_ARAVE|nr:hypothetical protein AVEN_182693-1 [Araneus ventricosus]
MLRYFLQPKLYEHGNLAVWFQQYGATAQTVRISMDLLKEMFPKRLISLRGDISWPAPSPDLSPCAYFLWGYLKSKVYKNKPRTTEELTAAIRQEIVAMTRRLMKNFWVRLQKCIDSKGRHLDDIIFKTKGEVNVENKLVNIVLSKCERKFEILPIIGLLFLFEIGELFLLHPAIYSKTYTNILANWSVGAGIQ